MRRLFIGLNLLTGLYCATFASFLLTFSLQREAETRRIARYSKLEKQPKASWSLECERWLEGSVQTGEEKLCEISLQTKPSPRRQTWTQGRRVRKRTCKSLCGLWPMMGSARCEGLPAALRSPWQRGSEHQCKMLNIFSHHGEGRLIWESHSVVTNLLVGVARLADTHVMAWISYRIWHEEPK